MTRVRKPPPPAAPSPAAPGPAVEPALDAGGAGVRKDPASCTPEARRRALELRGLKCPACGSYEVVPKKGRTDRYICAGCAKTGDFHAWVRIDR